MNHLHGVWLYACGHEAYRCKCIPASLPALGQLDLHERRYRSELCGECSRQLPRNAPSEPFPPATESAEPFPLATD